MAGILASELYACLISLQDKVTLQEKFNLIQLFG